MGRDVGAEILASLQGQGEYVVLPLPFSVGPKPDFIVGFGVEPSPVSKLTWGGEGGWPITVASVRVVARTPEDVRAVLLPSGETALAFSPEEAVSIRGGGRFPDAKRHSGVLLDGAGLFGRPEEVERFWAACKAGRCPAPELHCGARAFMEAADDGDVGRIVRLGLNPEQAEAAFRRALAGLAMGASAPSGAPMWAVAFAPRLERAVKAARRLGRGEFRAFAAEWLRRLRRHRAEASRTAYLMLSELAHEVGCFWPQPEACLPTSSAASAITFAEWHGAVPHGWLTAATLRQVQEQVSPTKWGRVAAYRPDVVRRACEAAVRQLRREPERLWSRDLDEVLRAMRELARGTRGTRRVVREFVAKVRRMRAMVAQLAAEAVAANRSRAREILSASLQALWSEAVAPYESARQVLEICPDLQVMSELAEGWA